MRRPVQLAAICALACVAPTVLGGCVRAALGSLLPGDACSYNLQCKYKTCVRVPLRPDFKRCRWRDTPCASGPLMAETCARDGVTCRANPGGIPEFPFRSSDRTRGIEVRYLGAAGLEISLDERRLLIDPYLARPWQTPGKSLAKLFALMANKDLLGAEFQAYYEGIARVDWLLVTHGHMDHVAEMGPIAVNLLQRKAGPEVRGRAEIVGSRNQCDLAANYSRRYGVDIACRTIEYRELHGQDPEATHREGLEQEVILDEARRIKTTWYPAHHSASLTAKAFVGSYEADEIPEDAVAFENDAVYHVLVEFTHSPHRRPARILVLASTHLHPNDPLPDPPVDLLLVALPTWDTRNADRELEFLRRLRPGIVVPTHFDNFFRDYREGCLIMKQANLPRFVREAAARLKGYGLPASQVILLDYGQGVVLEETDEPQPTGDTADGPQT